MYFSLIVLLSFACFLVAFETAASEMFLESRPSSWPDHDIIVGGRLPLSRSKRSLIPDHELLQHDSEEVPEGVDWRRTDCVTPVKHQYRCGSCWAFSAVGALEGFYCARTGFPAVSLSPQSLMDCVRHRRRPDGPKFGCSGGGSEDHAFHYIKRHGSVATEESYPYQLQNDTQVSYECRTHSASTIAYELKGYVRVAIGNETALKRAVALRGPVSVGIHASEKFTRYVSANGTDVFDDESCREPNRGINHAVLVVGYGTTLSGEDYWLVKNSYGVFWGDKGFVKLARNKHNHCFIASEAVYPL